PSRNTKSCTSPPFSILTTCSPCSSKYRAVGTFFPISGSFTIHFKSCNVSIVTTFLPVGFGRPDGNTQKIQRKGSKKDSRHARFFNGRLELLFLPENDFILSSLSD